ncbi:hypothetical protein EB796_004156 [Bugula neritina]|uniref:Peptidase S8/S53 domain-containing protein n=1 Tax=Bugula neritina TaxID=10212 RepID=A0A7J7KFV1_BUGNE|nr:hypothetical protein EB796_004156 [Bugula neritina]
MRYTYTLSILVTLWVVHCAGEHDDYVNQFVAYVDGAEKEVEGVKEFLQSNSIHIINTIKSDKHGYILHFQPNNSRIRSRSKRSSEGHSSITDLSSHPHIKSIRQEREIIREKRDYKSRQELAEAKRVVQKYLEELKLRSSQGQDRKEKITYDRQSELNYKRYYDNKDVFRRYQVEESSPPYDSSVYAILEDREYDPKESRYINLNDEHWKDQWYLDNTGQAGGPKFLDINVVPAWQQGYSGLNVSVCVLDDGIEHTHDDLRDNYWAEISTDFNSKVDDDPMPNPNQLDRNSHGTRCAGEIAAVANNSICGVGVAFNAKIGGVRILDGPVTDTLEADALLFQNQLIDIYSASWGPRDDGKTMEGPGKHCAAALEQGVREGRGGKGSIFVWATGNGGFNGDDCAADGYVSSPYTLSVGSINNYAESTYFMEWCPSTLAVIYTGGYHKRGDAVSNNEFTHPILKIVTTDVRNKCTLNFQGTSSAAPLAAGVMALALEANPSLTWRDLQHIVVVTSKVPNSVEKGWTINGAGLHINDKFGYGAIDAAQMVQVAQTWNNVGPQHTCTVKSTPGDVV